MGHSDNSLHAIYLPVQWRTGAHNNMLIVVLYVISLLYCHKYRATSIRPILMTLYLKTK